MKPGESFENLAAYIFAILSARSANETVTQNVLLDGVDGPRQIDVLITGSVGPFDVKTIVECKDYAKNVNIIAVDALFSKMLDVRAQKAVLVARKGFTQGARKKARRVGIDLCTIHSAEHDQWKFDLEIPIIVTELSCERYSLETKFTAIGTSLNLDDFLVVNDLPIIELLTEYWNNNDIECSDGTTVHSFRLGLAEPYWVHCPDGQRMELQDLQIRIQVNKTYYFGYANNLKSAKYLRFIEQDRREVMFDPTELSDYRTSMQKYNHVSDVPKVDGSIALTIKLLNRVEPERTECRIHRYA